MGHSCLGTWDPSRLGPTAGSRAQHPKSSHPRLSPRWILLPLLPRRSHIPTSQIEHVTKTKAVCFASSPYVRNQRNTFKKKIYNPLRAIW